ncbi:MAG TPA: transcription-repair coupling factor [Dehalococcoidia bacterium]|nr:transcription-repair coupling factor [Dehalococcoidia bacterium]
MNIAALARILDRTGEFNSLLNSLLLSQESKLRVLLTQPAKPLIISAVYSRVMKPLVVLASDADKAFNLYNQLSIWLPQPASVHHFPEKKSADSASRDEETLYERISTLTALLHQDGGIIPPSPVPVVVTSIMALRERILRPKMIAAAMQRLRVGDTFNRDQFLKSCLEMGYEADTRVEIPGTFVHRGGIIDIFPGNRSFPVRIELEGRVIVSMRKFDPKTQLSLDSVAETEIHTIAQIANLEDNCTLLDYLPADSIIVVDEYEEIFPEEHRGTAVASIAGQKDSDHIHADDASHVSQGDIYHRISDFARMLDLTVWNSAGKGIFTQIELPLSSAARYGGRLNSLIADLQHKLDAGYAVVICSQQYERLFELLTEKHLHVHKVKSIEDVPERGIISLLKGSLPEGWILDGYLAFYTDYEIFGWVKQERSSRRRPVRHHLLANQLKAGDYVVHIDHGIARFTGFQKMKAGEAENEYMTLEYAAGDKLYVPANQIERVGPYVGGKDQLPSLSRLHTQEWAQTKSRIKKSVEDIAKDLLQLYALRETSMGYSFSPDMIWQGELESSFPYVETSDQLRAVQDVKRDMEMNKPMDRLICGDVGYGKTEIALRAAFKAVMDSKQVAVLVPTTVLAQQHYLTFYSRLQAFPVNLKVLSRFTPEKEQAEVIRGLTEGSVDICIGTHRLLQKDVVFKNLGLVIIDEEQRFGVAHKEFFKKLRTAIDILTLSATPIPRTMHMSLSGIKDLSTLETPPEDRLPIKTFVGPYDAKKVRDAILYEIGRHGQVYYVHNRVQNIFSVAEELKKLVPEAAISIAHGQMREDELESVMFDFVNHRTDVLLTTTIIESGIDIPNANTLIIDNSDKLGLTQLYQLRGRIGRGANNAHAYLFFRVNKSLTDQARKRLMTIAEATELGAGYAIAMKDLEIRGAGNLLGTEQSGYISAIGFDLYCRLLADAVDGLKQGRDSVSLQLENLPDPSISLPLRAYIPEDYVQESDDRMRFYRLMAGAGDNAASADIEAELKDRFGPIPPQVKNLLYIARIRRAAIKNGIESVMKNMDCIVVQYSEVKKLVEHKLQGVRSKYHNLLSIGPAQVKLDYIKAGKQWKTILLEILTLPGANH